MYMLIAGLIVAASTLPALASSTENHTFVQPQKEQAHMRLVQMQLPPGTYASTCNSCEFDGRVLNCQCRNSNGQRRRSQLDWGGTCSNRSVANHEGQLVCGRQ
jgi:hypothetical protein